VFDWEVKENPYTNVPYKASDSPHQRTILQPSNDNVKSPDDASKKDCTIKIQLASVEDFEN
jgi:hypothetical protein